MFFLSLSPLVWALSKGGPLRHQRVLSFSFFYKLVLLVCCLNLLLVPLELNFRELHLNFYYAHCVEDLISIMLGKRIIKFGVEMRKLWRFKLGNFSTSAPSSVFFKTVIQIFHPAAHFSSCSAVSSGSADFIPQRIFHLVGSAVFIQSFCFHPEYLFHSFLFFFKNILPNYSNKQNHVQNLNTHSSLILPTDT